MHFCKLFSQCMLVCERYWVCTILSNVGYSRSKISVKFNWIWKTWTWSFFIYIFQQWAFSRYANYLRYILSRSRCFNWHKNRGRRFCEAKDTAFWVQSSQSTFVPLQDLKIDKILQIIIFLKTSAKVQRAFERKLKIKKAWQLLHSGGPAQLVYVCSLQQDCYEVYGMK